jgi:hypothetical protein
MKGKRVKDELKDRREFIVMNSQLEYFCGLAYGGQLVWDSEYKNAKPLDHENKFKTLQYLCLGEELVLDYIS